MKKVSWLYFEFWHQKPRTVVWRVRPQGEALTLGLVQWFSHWRKYCFFPCEPTVFDANCLREIADFCETRTQEHRTAAIARKTESGLDPVGIAHRAVEGN